MIRFKIQALRSSIKMWSCMITYFLKKDNLWYKLGNSLYLCPYITHNDGKIYQSVYRLRL